VNFQDPEHLFSLAEQFTADGKFNAAELMLRQAMELSENQEIYSAGLATLIGMQGNREEEAVKIIEDQLKIYPDNPNLLCAYGLTAQTAGFAQQAEDLMRKALSKRSDHPLAMHSLSHVLYDKGQIEEAERLACRAFTMVPDHPDFALTAIDLLEAQGKNDLAFEVAALGASFNPHEMELVQRAVEGALARKETERAWDAIKDSDEDLSWVLGWKATLLEHTGRKEEASELIKIGREKFWGDPSYLILEAAIWIQRHDMDQVQVLLERVLEIEPGNRTALKMRADHALELNDPELAVMDLEALYEEEPDDAKVALDLITAYYKCRRYEDAFELSNYWEDKLRREPQLYVPPQIRVYSSLAAASMGDVQAALWRSDWIGDEFLMDAINELNTFGGQELAEDRLRNRLMERLPEPDPMEEAYSQESSSYSPSVPEEKPVAAVATPAVEGKPMEMPLNFNISEGGEEWEYDDDEEVEVDEDGEEWVWVDEDDE
jgi:tetratricopeptide (TPR) repeat protein